jgi:hypothetical protein
VLLLAGLATGQLWGWQQSGLIIHASGRAVVPGRDAWVSLDERGRVSASPGLRVLSEAYGPGALLRALDGSGNPLQVQESPGTDPVEQLAIALTRDPDLATRDALAAVPEAGLIVRLVPGGGANPSAGDAILVQVYRSPSGELASEAVADDVVELLVDGVNVQVSSYQYVELSVASDPGAWPAAAGVLLLTASVLGAVIRRCLVARSSQPDDAATPVRDAGPELPSGGGV